MDFQQRADERSARALELPRARTPLARLVHADFQYVAKPAMEHFDRDDWARLARQRVEFNSEVKASSVLAMLAASESEPSFGYQINNYQHCLQAATMAYLDGLDEEDVVVALLHDVGFVVCPERHGAFAAELMGGYVSERNYWMLRHHQIFLDYHVEDHPDDDFDRHGRDRWRGHEHYEWTREFVCRYDQGAIDPQYDNAPLEFFEPMVHRIFARPARPLHLD